MDSCKHSLLVETRVRVGVKFVDEDGYSTLGLEKKKEGKIRKQIFYAVAREPVPVPKYNA